MGQWSGLKWSAPNVHSYSLGVRKPFFPMLGEFPCVCVRVCTCTLTVPLRRRTETDRGLYWLLLCAHAVPVKQKPAILLSCCPSCCKCYHAPSPPRLLVAAWGVWEKEGHPCHWTPFFGQVSLVVKNPSANAGDARDTSLIPGLVRSPGEGHGNPLPYSCLENPMDRGASRAAVHGVARRQTWLKRCSTA